MSDPRSGGTPAAAPIDPDRLALMCWQFHVHRQVHRAPWCTMCDDHVKTLLEELRVAGALSGVAPEPSEPPSLLAAFRLKSPSNHITIGGIPGVATLEGEWIALPVEDFERVSDYLRGAAGRGSAGPKRFFYRCTCGGEHEMGTAPPCGGGYLGEVPQ